MRRLWRNRMAVVCGVFFAGVVGFCLLGPTLAGWIGGVDATSQDPDLGAAGPSARHWFGTDPLGRDMLVRTMIGGRFALLAGAVTTFVALIVGVTWGAIAAYVGGKVDFVMMRIVDVLYGIPTVMFVIVVMSVVGSKSLALLFLLVGAISWLTMARIVRGQVMSLRHREFVEAARASGASPARVLFGHIVPNTLGPIIVYTSLQLPIVMLVEAFLSFLGLGVQAPAASWGTLVAEGAGSFTIFPWMLVGPGAVMALTIFALNFFGDGLRDALDPQTRGDY
jgi:oligopeptide transport system permease protein